MLQPPRLLLFPLFLLLLLAGSGTGAMALPAAAPAPPPGLRLLRADTTGLEMVWTPPPVALRLQKDGAVTVTAAGLPLDDEPGRPRLPFAAALIALPPGATPQLQVLALDEEDRPLPAPIAPAPRPQGVVRDTAGRPIGGGFAPAAPDPTGVPPTSPVLLEEVGTVRGIRLARLRLYPARPQGRHLRVVRRLRLTVRWSRPASAHAASPAPASSDPLLEAVRRQVLNPWDAIPALPAPRPRNPSSVSTQQASPQAFLEVDAPGLYRVTYEDLDPLGFATATPRNLRLFQGSREVAYEWEGDDDARFEPGEALTFYAEPRFSRWVAGDVYRLVADTTPGLRMATRSADPTGLPAGTPWVEQTVEENRLYTPDCFCGPLPTGRNGDRWAWEVLRLPDRTSVALPFATPAVDASQPATLTLWLLGYTDVSANPDHQVAVALNGSSLGSVTWNGKRAITATLAITPGLLQSDVNTLTLTLPGLPDVTVEGAWVDAFALRYAHTTTATGSTLAFEGGSGRWAYTLALTETTGLRAYDVTDPRHPRRLTGLAVTGDRATLGDPPEGGPRRYLLLNADGLRPPRRIRAGEPLLLSGDLTGADLLVITHPDFADALAPLLTLRRSQGLSVTVVSVLGLYDAYGDGRPDPQAIRAFIADAYASWTPRPAYVLLVGDGSFDPRRYRTDSPPTFIPPYLADADPWAGEVAADNRYVTVDGNDRLPDLLLGRLPVQTAAEAQTVVGKIVRYESAPFPGGWNANVLLVADDADAAGDFAASSETYAVPYVTAPFTVTRRYCAGSADHLSDCSPQETAELHTALLADWNRGALLVQFTGHASWQQWAAERFFHLDDLSSLSNDRRLPVVVEMTCFTGAFQRPEPTLDEGLVTQPGGGAVAAWGATGLGVGTGHDRLSQGFFQALFTDGVATVGEATLTGKLKLAASGLYLDLLDTFILLGDPALRPNRTIVPWASRLFLPLVARGA